MFSGLHKDPEIGLCSFFRELMLTDSGSSGQLPVNEDFVIVHFRQHVVKDGRDLFFCIGNVNLDESCAVEKAVQMLLEGKDFSVLCQSGLIDAVAEIAGAVVHRNGHLLQGSEFSIVIAKCFHQQHPLTTV